MRAVVQRVSGANVSVDGRTTGEIGPGLVVLVAVGKEDTAATASAMAEKVANLRIFGDDAGKMNQSLLDTEVRRWRFRSSRYMAMRADSGGRVLFRRRRRTWEKRYMKNLYAHCRRLACGLKPEYFRRICQWSL